MIFLDGGKCISFNPKDESIFLIGTDGGNVYQCTTDYSSIFIIEHKPKENNSNVHFLHKLSSRSIKLVWQEQQKVE